MFTIDEQPTIFRSAEEGKLFKHLEYLEKHTLLTPISVLKEITIQPNGTISLDNSDYKITTKAFRQMCAITSTSLFGLAQDLCGAHRTPDKPVSDYSVSDTIWMANTIFARRFDNYLRGRVIIRDTKNKLIEGIVSKGYQWFSNFQVMSLASEYIKQLGDKVDFHEATLAGRWLGLRYLHRDTYFTVILPGSNKDNYKHGYYFANDELGLSSIKSAAIVVRENGNTSAMSPIKGEDHVVHHQSPKFLARAKSVIQRALQHTKSCTFYRDHIEALPGITLGLDGSANDDRIKEELAVKINRRKLPISFASRMVDSSISNPAIGTADYGKKVSERNYFDLFIAFGREGRNFSIRHREISEQLAYLLMLGKL